MHPNWFSYASFLIKSKNKRLQLCCKTKVNLICSSFPRFNFAFEFKFSMKKKLIGYSIFFVVLVGLFLLFSFWGTDNWKAKSPTISTVQPFTFLNQDGKNFTEADLQGKVVVVNFLPAIWFQIMWLLTQRVLATVTSPQMKL